MFHLEGNGGLRYKRENGESERGLRYKRGGGKNIGG